MSVQRTLRGSRHADIAAVTEATRPGVAGPSPVTDKRRQQAANVSPTSSSRVTPAELDGSDTVIGTVTSPDQLSTSDRFSVRVTGEIRA
jgi:hypothetical protein